MYESEKMAKVSQEEMPKTTIAKAPPPVMPMPTADAGYGVRQRCKTLLLEHAERMRREANQLENLAYSVEQIHGDAENTLYRLLQGDFFRR